MKSYLSRSALCLALVVIPMQAFSAPGSRSERREQKRAYQRFAKKHQQFLRQAITATVPRRQVRQIHKMMIQFDLLSATTFRVIRGPNTSYTLCTLQKLAEAKEHIADSIRRAPLPYIEGLKWTPEAKKQYMDKIDIKFVTPLKREAIKMYGNVLQHARIARSLHRCARRAKRRKRVLQAKYR